MRFNRFLLAGAATALTFATFTFIAQESIAQDDFSMGFFITSSGPGNGADLGGLAGADAHCQTLAAAVGSGDRTWRAYLSAQAKDDQVAVNARDRIGSGPWHNAMGVIVANNVDELHGANNLGKETALNEKGEIVNGRGDSPNRHDILTGAQLDGTVVPGNGDSTCNNWTSSGDGSAMLGHHDRQGGGANPTSWNSAHLSRGCSQNNLRSTGGDGLFYCFAINALLAGDADQDLDFDQLDLVQVQIAAKYLTAQSATWGEGDWNGAPGGSQGSPPVGDGLFNQRDIVAAQQAGIYLTGAYAAILPAGQANDGQTSVVYDPGTGGIAVDAPAGTELTSINIDSAAGIFTGQAAANLGGSFDNDADTNIFKATFGSSFGSLSFGSVAQTGLSQEFVLGDLSVIGSLAGGGDLGNVDLVYVPEPSTIGMLALGFLVGLRRIQRTHA
jgi:hypothetical protein